MLKMYKDNLLTQEITTLDFGVLAAGTSKKYEIFLFNDSNATLQNLEFKIEHKEIKIIESPVEINPYGKSKLVVEWSPSVTLKEALKTKMSVDGFELYS